MRVELTNNKIKISTNVISPDYDADEEDGIV